MHSKFKKEVDGEDYKKKSDVRRAVSFLYEGSQ